MTFDQLTLTGEFAKGARLFDGILNRPGVANFTLNNARVRMEIQFQREKVNEEQSRYIAWRHFIDIDPEKTYHSFSEFRKYLLVHIVYFQSEQRVCFMRLF